jgi:hypothetical protein
MIINTINHIPSKLERFTFIAPWRGCFKRERTMRYELPRMLYDMLEDVALQTKGRQKLSLGCRMVQYVITGVVVISKSLHYLI